MLKDEIADAKRTVSTDTVQITIGEVANMYANHELNIVPEFQRLFRWSPERKSNFVESILIGIPIPPAFVYENGDGTWELIDGLQRISTILEFMGVLKDPDSQERRRSQLMGTKYLPSLEGVVWDIDDAPILVQRFDGLDEDESGSDSTPSASVELTASELDRVELQDSHPVLDKALQLFFRRHRIDFQILKHPSDPKTKFDLFQRLNRGGAYANEQEVRSCAMVLANSEFTAKMKRFAARDDFQKIFQVTPEQRKSQKDLEYAVRAVVHTYEEYKRGPDVQEFLDQAILKIMRERDPAEVLSRVGWAVSILHMLLGDSALTPPDDRLAGIAPRFSLRALEGIVVGLARNRDAILGSENPNEFVRSKVAGFWLQPDITTMSSPGLRGTVRLQRSVAFGAQWFQPDA